MTNEQLHDILDNEKCKLSILPTCINFVIYNRLRFSLIALMKQSKSARANVCFLSENHLSATSSRSGVSALPMKSKSCLVDIVNPPIRRAVTTPARRRYTTVHSIHIDLRRSRF